MTMAFQLDGQEFVALNGGPHFKFTEALSFVVNCESQDEVDHYWGKFPGKSRRVMKGTCPVTPAYRPCVSVCRPRYGMAYPKLPFPSTPRTNRLFRLLEN